MGPNTRELEGLQAQQATRLADFSVPLTIKDHYKNLTVSRYSSVDGTDAILVTGRPAPDVIEQLFFDKANGLLLRRVILDDDVVRQSARTGRLCRVPRRQRGESAVPGALCDVERCRDAEVHGREVQRAGRRHAVREAGRAVGIPSFLQLFGHAATVAATAPGRVNLIGEHTDYNGGFVLPAAIPLDTRVEIAPASGRRVRVWSAQFANDPPITFELGAEVRSGDWADYVRGITWSLSSAGSIEGFTRGSNRACRSGAGSPRVPRWRSRSDARSGPPSICR